MIIKYLYRIIALILILFGVLLSNDIKQTLLKFPYSSEKISASARSIIIHYFQAGQYDSIDMVIDFCDTLSTLNSDWLSGHERILIELLKGNLSALKNSALYKQHLALCDTAIPESLYFRPPVYDPHTHTIPPYDNLSPFLKRNYQQKIQVLKNRYPDDEYLWDFLDILFDYTHKKVVKYLVNYPDFPFSNLVRYNFLVRYEYKYHGVMWGAGASFLNFDHDINLLFRDRISFFCFADTYLWGFSLNISLNVSNRASSGNLIIGTDTISIGTSFLSLFADLSVGHIISIYDRVYLTPYIGFGGFKTYPNYEKNVSLPSAWGGKLGLSTNIRLSPRDTKFITSIPKPDIALRVDMGFQYNLFDRIRDDLGRKIFYFNLAIEMIMFRFKRSFEVN